jgi:hypothetical protein
VVGEAAGQGSSGESSSAMADDVPAAAAGGGGGGGGGGGQLGESMRQVPWLPMVLHIGLDQEDHQVSVVGADSWAALDKEAGQGEG